MLGNRLSVISTRISAVYSIARRPTGTLINLNNPSHIVPPHRHRNRVRAIFVHQTFLTGACGGHGLTVARMFAIGATSLSSQNFRFMVVGLGNSDLPRTRHSVGMTAVNHLATWLELSWRKERALRASVAETMVDNQLLLVLLKSKHPMNHNGKSIAKAASHYSIPPENVFLVHDDLDKSLGKFGVKEGGSARGHNGVRSAISCMQTEGIPRLRIGIDRPVDKSQVVSYVLEPFSPDEMPMVKRTIPLAMKALLHHIVQEHSVDIQVIQQIKKKIPS